MRPCVYVVITENRTKKQFQTDTHTQDPEGSYNLGGNQFFSLLGQSKTLPAAPRPRKLSIHCIHNTMGVLRVSAGALWIDECTCLLSEIHGTMLRWLLR